MQLEIRLKYYNSTLKIGLNSWRKIYDCNTGLWVDAAEHKGRLVYGNKRIPYKRIKAGIDQRDFVIQEYLPF